MSGAVIGGNVRYPSLQAIANLFRSQINDTFSGATDTPGEGLIMFNQNPDLLTFMDSAIRDVYSDLRNVGDPSLILDNYILLGLPALAQPDPTVQVSISYAGFFDGYQWHSQWTLPISCQKVERLWERWSGTGLNFTPMQPAPLGLSPCNQTQWMGQLELRQNAIWMPGSLVSEDIRIRCRITFPDFINPEKLDFTTAYIPIVDCQNAVVAKMLVLYSKRFAPDLYQMSVAEDERLTGKLRFEVVRQMQANENQRLQYGDEATGSFGWLSSL